MTETTNPVDPKPGDTVTLYAVDDDWGRGPITLVTAQAKRTPQSFRLLSTENSRPWDFRTMIPPRQAHLTPQAALVAARDKAYLAAERARRDLAVAETIMAAVDKYAADHYASWSA
jgi:hypothetical protein